MTCGVYHKIINNERNKEFLTTDEHRCTQIKKEATFDFIIVGISSISRVD
jgi:hypothetical protein